MTAPASDKYKTILVIVTGMLAIGWIFDLASLWKIAAIIGAVSVLVPAFARALEWLWFRLAIALGWINSRILLSVIYFVFLMPIAWLSRLFVKDPLSIRNTRKTTLFTTRDHVYTRKDLENIW